MQFNSYIDNGRFLSIFSEGQMMRMMFALLVMLMGLKLVYAAPAVVDNIKSPCEKTYDSNKSLCSSENEIIKEPPITSDEKNGAVIKPPVPVEPIDSVPDKNTRPAPTDIKKYKN